MKTIWKRTVALTVIYVFLGLGQGLQADDGPRYYRPTVQVSVNATGNGPLHYKWRATDGSISNVDAPTTRWTLPSGPGLHFAYVLVSDHMGGYTEGRVAVNTDALGTRPESFAAQPLSLNAPPAPARIGDAYRAQLGYYESVSNCYDGYDYDNGHYGCDVYAPGVQVYLRDAQGVQYPSDGVATTDSIGYFSVEGVPPSPIGFTIYCNLVSSSNFAPCDFSNASIPRSSNAFTEYYTYTPADSGFSAGSVSLSDGNLCGTNNELFGIHRAATVTLLDASGNPLASTPVDGFGNYTFAAPVANAVTARFSCEGAPAQSQPIQNGYAAGGFSGTGAPLITEMTAPLNGGPGEFLGQIFSPQDLSYQNLAFKGIDSRKAACLYYKAIGAVQSCGEGGQFHGAISYQDWQRSVRIGQYAREGGVRAHATYVNKVDLNLTRVQRSIRYGTTSLATVVCNHRGPPDFLNPSQASIDQAMGNAIAGKDLIACVAMDYQLNPGVNGNQKFVRFYIFGPSGQLLPSVNLDGGGEKFMPGSCISCHGGEHYAGHYPEDGTGSADFGGHMLPYDKGNFEFSDVDGLNEARREEAIYELNQNLLAVDPPATAQVEGALTVAGKQLISGWYANGHTLDQQYVPAAWQSFDQGYSNFDYRLSDTTNLFYRRVIARACRTCHVNQENYNFEDPHNIVGESEMVARTTCGSIDGYDVSHHLGIDNTMPNSYVTYNRYWGSQGTTDPATGETTDMPQILEKFLGPGLNGSWCGNSPYPHYFSY